MQPIGFPASLNSFNHRFRGANKCVNSLARMRSYQDSDFILYVTLSVDTNMVYKANLCGLYSNMHCPEPLFVI